MQTTTTELSWQKQSSPLRENMRSNKECQRFKRQLLQSSMSLSRLKEDKNLPVNNRYLKITSMIILYIIRINLHLCQIKAQVFHYYISKVNMLKCPWAKIELLVVPSGSGHSVCVKEKQHSKNILPLLKEIPWRHSWNITFMRMGWTGNQKT